MTCRIHVSNARFMSFYLLRSPQTVKEVVWARERKTRRTKIRRTRRKTKRRRRSVANTQKIKEARFKL